MARIDISESLMNDLKNLQRAIKDVYGERFNLEKVSDVYAKMRRKPRNKSLGELIKEMFGD